MHGYSWRSVNFHVFLSPLGTHPQFVCLYFSAAETLHLQVSTTCTFVEGVWGPFLSALLPHHWSLEGGQSAVASLVSELTFGHFLLAITGNRVKKLVIWGTNNLYDMRESF